MWYRFLLSLLFFSSLTIYLFINIKNLTQGSVVLWVLILSIFLGLSLLLSLLLQFNFSIKKSFIFLLFFLIYFCIKIFFDLEDLESINRFTIATNAGIILFYILGLTSRFAINSIFNLNYKTKYKKLFNVFLLTLFFLFSFLIVDVLLSYLPGLRIDKFYLQNFKGFYQRAGDFIAISSIYMTVIYNLFIIIRKHKEEGFFFTNFFKIIFYFTMILNLGISQMIGSNKATVLLIGFLILSIMIDLFNSFKFNRIPISKILIINLKSKTLYKFSSFFLLSLLPLIFFLFLVLYFFNIDINQLRITGWGSLEISSIIGRLNLFNNFWIHSDYAPIFGNMNVHTLTTGEGSYVHSFILSLITHTGLFGFFIFVFYLFFATKELLSIKITELDNKYLKKLYFDNNEKIFYTFLFLIIFIIGSIGTFFTWAPLWFTFGLIFPPIELKLKKMMNF